MLTGDRPRWSALATATAAALGPIRALGPAMGRAAAGLWHLGREWDRAVEAELAQRALERIAHRERLREEQGWPPIPGRETAKGRHPRPGCTGGDGCSCRR